MPIKAAGNSLTSPDDFNETLRMSVFDKVQKRHANHPDFHTEFVGAWGALQYRFYACTEHDEAFTNSLRSHGDAPNPLERFHQEKDLFNFFMNGMSAIECLCYGLFAIGAMRDPSSFPFAPEPAKDRRNVNPKNTAKCFKRAFPNDSLSAALATMCSSNDYEEWDDMRRFLFHRIHPGRRINASIRGGELPATWIEGKNIDENTTAGPRKRLVGRMNELLTNADSFVSDHL